jgi:hypothetical protein
MGPTGSVGTRIYLFFPKRGKLDKVEVAGVELGGDVAGEGEGEVGVVVFQHGGAACEAQHLEIRQRGEAESLQVDGVRAVLEVGNQVGRGECAVGKVAETKRIRVAAGQRVAALAGGRALHPCRISRSRRSSPRLQCRQQTPSLAVEVCDQPEPLQRITHTKRMPDPGASQYTSAILRSASHEKLWCFRFITTQARAYIA